jgi:uncharacterized membrane protein YdbT with pleckstrin-like domain
MVAGLPAILPLGFVALVLGDQVGLDPFSALPVITAVVVLITVLISVLIAWLQRHRSGSRF